MGFLKKLFGIKKNDDQKSSASKQQREGCIKCGNRDFEYDSYFNEYICKSCGWSVDEKPKGIINIVELSKKNVAVQNSRNEEVKKKTDNFVMSKDQITIPAMGDLPPVTVPKLALDDCKKWQIEFGVKLKMQGFSGEDWVRKYMNTVGECLMKKYSLNVEEAANLFAYVQNNRG